MNNVIKLVVGDWSNDGHGRTHSTSIRSSITNEEIQSAYELGVKNLGVSISTLCEEYEDSEIPSEARDVFVKAGYVPTDFDPEMDTVEQCLEYIDPEAFVELYLFTVKQGNSEFTFEFIESDDINIGGYGLFT